EGERNEGDSQAEAGSHGNCSVRIQGASHELGIVRVSRLERKRREIEVLPGRAPLRSARFLLGYLIEPSGRKRRSPGKRRRPRRLPKCPAAQTEKAAQSALAVVVAL